MSELAAEVRVLPPMTVIAAHVTSTHPEVDAWDKLAAWAGPAGLLDDATTHPVFGFNNPPPEAEDADYGYEMWIRVDPEAPPAPNLERKEFPGGRYAVTACRLHGDPHGSVPEVWRQLLAWVAEHRYRWRRTHELEHVINPGATEREITLELYLPIEDD